MAEDRRDLTARRAQFADVTPDASRRRPRWLSGTRSSVPPSTAGARLPSDAPPSLRAAPVPKEFVRAVRRELVPSGGLESLARAVRGSEAPPPVVSAAPEPRVAAAGASAERSSAELAALQQAFRGAVEGLAVAQERLLEETAGQLATLAAVIARRVIARELQISQEILAALVREALDALSDQSEIRIRVGRGFQNALGHLEQQLVGRSARFQISLDADVDDYACFVESDLGQVDESVETRLEKLLEALKPDSEAP
jgi:flagellar assembly protein FliH